MKAQVLTLLLALAFSAAMVASANAMDSIGTPGHVNPGDHNGPDDHSKPGDHDKPDDHGKSYDHGKPDGYGKPYDQGRSDHHGKPGDHGKGTVIVTLVGPKGRPASGASVSMDGRLVGSTNLQGKLTIQNVSPGDHRISAAKTSWRESLRGSAQIRVRGKQTIQTSITLFGKWR